MRTCNIADVCVSSEVLMGARQIRVRKALVYTNVTDLNPLFGAHLEGDVYVERECNIAPVMLSRLPAATLYGGDEYLVECRGHLLVEQIGPYLSEETRSTRPGPLIEIQEECALIARFGIYTWGHWLCELLPKLVAVEVQYPGRFRYALPHHVLNDRNPELAWARMRESLVAYGIHAGRVLALRTDANYRFGRLYAIDSVWSDHAMHPEATGLMRDCLSVEPEGMGDERVAIGRIGGSRKIDNIEAVDRVLADRDFVCRKVGSLPFLDQVRIFQSASVVFGVLGSDLAGLIYSPAGVRVISAAPRDFGDRFFYALIQERGGRYADLRGLPTEPTGLAGGHPPFEIDPAQLRAAATALDI